MHRFTTQIVHTACRLSVTIGSTMIHTLYLIHHSHTDIGFTADQPVIWDLHGRFIERALDVIEADGEGDAPERFRWTCETALPVWRWLRQAPVRQRRRFQRWEAAGRVEVCAQPLHLAPLYQPAQLADAFACVRALRDDFGLTITSAMSCDINGHNWPLADWLLDLGVRGQSMAINTHFGRAPLTRPLAFDWQAPSGRRLPAWNGFVYGAGNVFAQAPEALAQVRDVWWPKHQAHLHAIGYRLPMLMMQAVDPFGDNGGPDPRFGAFLRAWNAEPELPRVVLATPRMWWAALAEAAAEHPLPVHAGDWTDFWNFGAGSAARELAVATRARASLYEADTVAALALATCAREDAQELAGQRARYRADAGQAATVWMEHTWGADCGIGAPGAEDTASMWAHKASSAYTARSLGQLLRRDAAAALAGALADVNDDHVALINPLPWARTVCGVTPASIVPARGRNADADASRHAQDRHPDTDLLDKYELDGMWPGQNPEYLLPPTDVPALGIVRVPKASLIKLKDRVRETREAVVETAHHRLTFNLEGPGGIRAWHDLLHDHAWVDPTAGLPLGGYVHERVGEAATAGRQAIFYMDWASPQVLIPDGWRPDWPAERAQPDAVVGHRVLHAPHGTRVTQHLQAPGAHGPVRVDTFLPAYAPWIEITAEWWMGLETAPQAAYLVFPFALPGAVARVDVGVAMQAGVDQLAGVCMDYFTSQGYVDFDGQRPGTFEVPQPQRSPNDSSLGMTVATPENPLCMLGGFHFGQAQTTVAGRPAWFVGWVVNNYWETNFRAHQPGLVRARYRLVPRRAAFHEPTAARFAAEAAHDRPLMQKLGEVRRGGRVRRPLPYGASLLHLPEVTAPDGPVVTRRIAPGPHAGEFLIELFNTAQTPAEAVLASGVLRLGAAWVSDAYGHHQMTLPITGATLTVSLPARQTGWVVVRTSGVSV
jgi:hypothetical protein